MALKGYGALLQYGSTADYTTSTWTTIANVANIKPPKMTAKDIDTTHLTSPGEFEEFIAGLANGGEVEATLHYEKTLTGTLYGFFRTIKGYRIHYSDGSGWKFNGYLSEIGDQEVVNGDIVRSDIKIKVTAAPLQDDVLIS